MPEPSPVTSAGRDLRLDLLRGLCVARMILVHLGWNSVWIRWPFGLISAAEGFFLISGITLGRVGRRYTESGRAVELYRRLLFRAGWLWLANTALVVILRKLSGTCVSPPGELAWFWGDTPPWLQILSFDQPSVLHVLPRYVVFLAVAPLVLAALAAGKARWISVASIALWALHLRFPGELRLPLLEGDRSDFPVAAWQLLFVGGMVLGYRRPAGATESPRPNATLALAAALAAGFAAFELFVAPALQATDPYEIFRAFGRAQLAPGRLLNLAALAVVLWYLTDRYFAPISRAAGWLLLPLGQNALAAFLLHIVISWPLHCITASAATPPWSVALLAWTSLLLVTSAVRQRWIVRFLAPV